MRMLQSTGRGSSEPKAGKEDGPKSFVYRIRKRPDQRENLQPEAASGDSPIGPGDFDPLLYDAHTTLKVRRSERSGRRHFEALGCIE